MQHESLDEKEVISALKKILRKDASYSSGKILSSMCSEPLDITKKVSTLALSKNIGDKFLFSGAVEVERETVSMLGSLLSNPDASGHIVSGGTEANMTALWVAKKLNKDDRSEVIIPESAHFSFERAADMLGLKLVRIPLTDAFKIDVCKVKESLNDKTLAIVGVAGSTALGAVDPITDLSDISLEHDLYLHVDAAFGGFVLPFLKNMGIYDEIFDFESPGVRSITIDPHKMGLCPIPAGGILFRDSSFLSNIGISVDYISRSEPNITTISCTRPAYPAVAVWAAMKRLGRSGYSAIVKKCIDNTLSLYHELKKLEGVHLLVKPTINILGFDCSAGHNDKVVDKLFEKGWATSLFSTHIRLIVMPHTETEHLKEFLSDLEEVLESLKN